MNKIKVTVRIIPGTSKHICIGDGSTVSDVVAMCVSNNNDCYAARIGNNNVNSDRVLQDNDIITLTFGAKAAAPVPIGDVGLGVCCLRSFTSNAKSLIIIDPYIFHPPNRSPSSHYYMEYLRKATNADGEELKKIHFICKEPNDECVTLNEMKGYFSNDLVCFSYKFTNTIHDRIWIKDDLSGKAVGTSLNGLGNRLSFILDLPDGDLDYIRSYLDCNNLLF